jgi:hypothetical protein
MLLFARRLDFFVKLFEGDPVAWTFLIIAIVIAVAVAFFKRWMRGGAE